MLILYDARNVKYSLIVKCKMLLELVWKKYLKVPLRKKQMFSFFYLGKITFALRCSLAHLFNLVIF